MTGRDEGRSRSPAQETGRSAARPALGWWIFIVLATALAALLALGVLRAASPPDAPPVPVEPTAPGPEESDPSRPLGPQPYPMVPGEAERRALARAGIE